MVAGANRPDIARLIGRILTVAAVAFTAAGCTYVAAPAQSDSPTMAAPRGSAAPDAPSTSVAVSWGAPLSGRFISQGTRTVGVARIAGTATGATLTLDGVSTTPNPDLKIILNEGALSKDTSGDMVVQDPKFLDIGAQVKPGSGSQTFELPPYPPFAIRSVTIMDSRTNVAYGTADLNPGPALG